MTFDSYASAGFGADLLPVIPPDATIAPSSPAFANLEKSKGKIPGKLSREGWFGFAQWTTHTADAADHVRWTKWGAGIGIQTRAWPAIDIDIDDKELADAIEKEIIFELGDAPVRYGRAGRRILVFACGPDGPFGKRRLVFHRRRGPEGPAPGTVRGDRGAVAERSDGVLSTQADGRAGAPSVDADSPDGSLAIEVLCAGGQFVAEGVHPRTGEPYRWKDGRDLGVWGAENLVPVTAAEIDALLGRLTELMAQRGYERVAGGRSGDGGSGGGVSGSLRAPSLAAVRAALEAIPNDVDYDEYLKIMAAVKAATEGLGD